MDKTIEDKFDIIITIVVHVFGSFQGWFFSPFLIGIPEPQDSHLCHEPASWGG